MARLRGVYAALALCLALLGGAAWLRAALAREYARGETHGRMAAALAAQAAADMRRAELEALRGRAESEGVAIDRAADELLEKVHDLETRAAPHAGGGVCIDADLVRALAAIGRGRRAGDRP